MNAIKWTRDTGKPYIRRANGKEIGGNIQTAFRLAYCRMSYGFRGFYVMIQRRTGREVMGVGRTRQEIVRSIMAVRPGHPFREWANRMKLFSQGRL